MMSDSPDTMINIANSLEVNTNNSLTDNDMINPGNLNASISAIRQLADMHSDRLPATDEEVIVSISRYLIISQRISFAIVYDIFLNIHVFVYVRN